MILQELIDGHGLSVVAGDGSVWATGLSEDSRTVRAGEVFVARSGTQTDGRRYMTEAIRRGAVAVIADGPPPDAWRAEAKDRPVAWVRGRQVDQALIGPLAERFFGHPSGQLKLIGVTGTNGKTTTACMIQHLLQRAGCRCGLIGTIWVDDGVQRVASSLTTPGAITFSRHLAAMVANGCQAAVVEVSSHGLDQNRVAALKFDGAVFTNLTGDHLDYHQSIEAYAVAKAKLFEQLPQEGWSVLNQDDAHARFMAKNSCAKPVWCSMNTPREKNENDIDRCWGSVVHLGPDHSRVRLDGPWGTVDARLPLAGRHNVANMLQAVAAASRVAILGTGLSQSIESCPPIPGRLERVRPAAGLPQDAPLVFVDYAHTHDALENALLSLRAVMTRGRLSIVFGCGGDRDRSKRPKMAAVACQVADRVIVTTDNPRFEDPNHIIDEILAGVPSAALDRVTVEADRAVAIAAAIGAAQPGDTVLLAGKGHEDYQVIGTDKIHFDDREHAEQALRVWGGRVPV